MSDDDSVGQPAIAQSSADNPPFLDSRNLDPKLSTESPKPPGQDLRMTMANSTADPLASPVPEPSTDPDVLVGTPAYKRGRGEIDEPVSVDSSNSQDLSQLYEGGNQQPYAPNAAKKQKRKQNSDTQTITSPGSGDLGGLEESGVDGGQVCQWEDGGMICGFISTSGNDLAAHMEDIHVPRDPYVADATQEDVYVTPQECGWKNCGTKVKTRRYHFCSHARSHAVNYAPPKDGGKCLYCGDTYPMSQSMRKHVKAKHPGGLEEMDANKAEDHAAKKDAEAAIQESNVAKWEYDAAKWEEDALKHKEPVASKKYETAEYWWTKAKHTKNGARRLRDEAQDSRDEAHYSRGVAQEKKKKAAEQKERDAAEGKDNVAKKEDVATKMAKRVARKRESVESKLSSAPKKNTVAAEKQGEVISEQTATARCASTPSKAPRPFNISRGLKPATKSSPTKSLREQYKESSALGFTTEEESSTPSESDDEADTSPAAEIKAPKSTVATRNPLPPGLRSTQSVSSPASKLKYPPALLAACSALDNLINPQLKEEIAADASSYTAQLFDDKHGAEIVNTIEAATQLLQQLAAANTGRYNALGELQNGVVEIAKKRESQLEALEREVALLKQQMK